MPGKIRQSNLNKEVIKGQIDNPSSAVATDDSVLIYDTSLNQLRKTNTSNIGIQAPTVTAVSPTNVARGEGQGTVSFTITGTGFNAGTTAKLITNGGTNVQFNSVTIDSLTQLTCVANRSDFLNANEPYDVSVTNGTGLNVLLQNSINVDGAPTFTTAAGSLGSCRASGTFIVEAADPESGSDPQFALESGSFPPGMSITNQDSGRATISGSITGTLPSSDTVYNFTLKAFDANSNVSFRAFSITVVGPSFTTITATGTYSVPSGTSAVDVLVVAGGGGSRGYPGSRPADPAIHGNNGGGGAGGLIFMPGFPVTPGGTVSVTVGGGGEFADGQDSVFGTLTAKGGGVGKQAFYIIGYQPGNPGGSGGGSGQSGRGPGAPGGTGTQPTQPGNSGAYGFGNPGGAQGGGGGGAGTSGGSGTSGNGGDGKAYTIADGTTSVIYAGGGGGVSGSGGTGGGGPNPAPSVSDQVQDGLDGRGSGGGGRPVASGPVNSPRSTGGTGIVIVKA